MPQSLSKQAPATVQAAEPGRRLQTGNHSEEVTERGLALHHQLLQGIFHTAGNLLSQKTSEGETPHRDHLLAITRTRLGPSLPRATADDIGARERLHEILKAAIELTEDEDF